MRERTGPTAVFVPESIAVAQISERLANDAAKDGTDHTARRRPFRDAGRPQIDVVWGGVDVGVALQRVVGEHPDQVVPVSRGRETAVAPESVVRWNTVISAALHVERSQIETPSVLTFLEQVVRQLDQENQTPPQKKKKINFQFDFASALLNRPLLINPYEWVIRSDGYHRHGFQ